MFSDGDLDHLNKIIRFNDRQGGETILKGDELKALIARLELAEQKDCNQYHCGHASCNAWRKSAGRRKLI